jgi:UDPglucose 6-dehydrogenase
MDIISAEMTKYAANSMLAAKISFINDIANLVKSLVLTLIKFELDLTRIGHKFIYPGIGYGGSCFKRRSSINSNSK